MTSPRPSSPPAHLVLTHFKHVNLPGPHRSLKNNHDLFLSCASQDGSWKAKEQSEEARYAHAKVHPTHESTYAAPLTPAVLQEQEQLAALRAQHSSTTASSTNATTTTGAREDIEGGFGGQEDLEDRYATTSGEH
jgi:hypothetical protein